MHSPERRFDEAEVAAIFERATAREAASGRHLVPSGGSGLTLGQLQEIGREIGIAPHDIAEAAGTLGQRVEVRTRRFLGLPLGVERTVHLPRRLTDEEWERLVVALRETFDARGVVKQEGSLRHWRNGSLQVLLEPTDTAQRVRLRTFKSGAPMNMGAGAALFGVGATGIVSAVMSGAASDAGMMTALAVMAAAGAGLLSLTALTLFPWARRRQEQMAEIAARAAAIAGARQARPDPSTLPPTTD